MDLELFVRIYKKQITWIIIFGFTIGIIYGIQNFLNSYTSLEDQTQRYLTSLSIIGISFILIFFIFTFVKLYKNGKNAIEKTLDEQILSFKNWAIFTLIAVIINVDIALLIETGALGYIFAIFPEIQKVITEVGKESVSSLDTRQFGDFFNSAYNNNLMFKFIFSAVGSSIIVFLRHIRKLEIKKNSNNYPGSRLLMIFFLVSIVGIIVGMQSNPIDSVHVISNLTFLTNIGIFTSVFSLTFYFIETVFFTKIK